MPPARTGWSITTRLPAAIASFWNGPFRVSDTITASSSSDLAIESSISDHRVRLLRHGRLTETATSGPLARHHPASRRNTLNNWSGSMSTCAKDQELARQILPRSSRALTLPDCLMSVFVSLCSS
jgi:hypothetical protein